MQQILTERHPDKTKQKTNWSVSNFKGKLKFSRFKIVKYKTRTFNRKFEIKPVPSLLIFGFQRTITSVRFGVGFDAQFHRLCYKTIGSCF